MTLAVKISNVSRLWPDVSAQDAVAVMYAVELSVSHLVQTHGFYSRSTTVPKHDCHDDVKSGS